MTTVQMAQLILTTVLFVTVILAGTFGVEIASVWLRNRREERANTVREAEKRIGERFDRERESWLAILGEKDRELESMTQMVKRLEKNYEIATKVLAVADVKGEKAA